MCYLKLVTAIFLVLLVALPCANAENNEMCDYYDVYANFIISFPKDISLRKSGPSAVSGIGFNFPDGSTLSFIPEADLYNPPDIDPDSEASRNDARFIQAYAQEACRVTKLDVEKKTIISCDNYEYSIIESTKSPKHTVYISIFYDFKSKKYDYIYHAIVDSLVIIPEYANRGFNFYNAAIQANATYYFAQNSAYKDAVDMYKLPDIVCGNYRIRDELLKNF